MDFQSPIVAGSSSRINASNVLRKKASEVSKQMANLSDSFSSPSNRLSYSHMTEDYMSQTYFDNDPTFTRIGTQKHLLDETRANLTMFNHRTREEPMSMLLEEETPGIEDAMQLFDNFLATFQKFGSEHQIFNQIAEYENKCTEQVHSLRRLIQIAPQGHRKLVHTQELEQELRLERDTWRLVASLYQDKLNSDSQDSEVEDMWTDLDGTASEQDLVKQLYEKNATLRQAQLVVDWLEQRAADVYHDSHYSQVIKDFNC